MVSFAARVRNLAPVNGSYIVSQYAGILRLCQ